MTHLKKPARPCDDMMKIHDYNGHKSDFKKFLSCTKNIFLRKILFLRQYGRCPKCSKNLIDCSNGTSVHHNSYEIYCKSIEPDINIYFPTKFGGVSRMVPNCKICYFKTPELAENCLKELCLMHSTCHNDLHHDQ